MLAALGTARAELAGLAEQPVWTLSDGPLADAVAAAVGLVAQAQAVLVRLVGEVDARGVATATGAPTTVSWLKQRHKLHPGEAAQLVRTAAAFRGRATANPGRVDGRGHLAGARARHRNNAPP